MDIVKRVISASFWLILVSFVLPRAAGNAEGGGFFHFLLLEFVNFRRLLLFFVIVLLLLNS